MGEKAFLESRRIAIETDLSLKAANKDYAGAALLQAELTALERTAQTESQELSVQGAEKKASAIEREMETKAASGDYGGAALLQTKLKALKSTKLRSDIEQRAARGDYAGAAKLQSELGSLTASGNLSPRQTPEGSRSRPHSQKGPEPAERCRGSSKSVPISQLLRVDVPMPTRVNLEAVRVMCVGKPSTLAVKGKGKGKNKYKSKDKIKGKDK